MPYNRQIPNAPISMSMLPRATELSKEDLLYLVRPNKPLGQRCKSLDLGTLFGSELLSPEKVIISTAPNDGSWTVNLGILKQTNRLILNQNTLHPKSLVTITMSGEQELAQSYLEIVVNYGSWNGTLSVQGLSSGSFSLKSIDGEWIKGLINNEGRLVYRQITGKDYNKSSSGFSGDNGSADFELSPDGFEFSAVDSNSNRKTATLEFDEVWKFSGIDEIDTKRIECGIVFSNTNTFLAINPPWNSYDYDVLTLPHTSADNPYKPGQMVAVVNKSASNAMLVSYNDIDTSNPVSVSVTPGHAIILLCYAVQMIGDDSYCNLFCKVS